MDAIERPGARESVHCRAVRRGQRERGMVTAELVVATLAVVTLLGMLCWGVQVVVLQARCVAVAAEVARQSARGDTAAVRRVRQDAPLGSTIAITTRGGVTKVTVRLDARPPLTGLPAVPLEAQAEVVEEPGLR